MLRPAQACGGFFSKKTSERRPSLSYEQALIVYDAAAEREHFVREVAFKEGTSPFGFVVPTPTRPEVRKVEHSPFNALREHFPFEPPKRVGPTPGAFGSGLGRLGGGHGGVTVLEVRKVGSFTAFVLAADDERGLANWLRDNGLVSTPEADVWLAHYVRMKFYYVAMRYDPPPSGGDAPGQAGATVPLKAETIRISFATPIPYYPYFEPAGPGASPRLLELWLATDAERTPVAAKTENGKTSWLSPFEPGMRYAQSGVTRGQLEEALDPELHKFLPSGDLVVQGFQDQKSSRNGWGDALFAPVQHVELDAAKAARLEPLLGILDPALVPAKGMP
jgi:hypothetical protein